jgi:murein DD-endopeptidase MepM/ murein hydrolase activator NlpD
MTPYAVLTGHRPGTSDGLSRQEAPELSRSAERKPPPSATAGGSRTLTPAERRAAVRQTALSAVAGQARSYAKQVARTTWVLPVRHFRISTWFGESGWEWSSGYHTGIDFVSGCYSPEVAVTRGVVARAGWDGPYGYQVRLRLPNGDQVWYNHMIEIKTRVGATLPQGGLIGLMGQTGNAYGCHLHFEYRVRGALKKPVDPAPYFAQHGIHLHVLQANPARLHRAKR